MVNFQRKLSVVVLTNTEADPFGIADSALAKLTRVVARVLERKRVAEATAALPTLQKYVGRFVLADSDASGILTFREFDVSIVNQKLVLTVTETLPGSVVYMKETSLELYGENVFHVAGGSFYGNFITFESSNDGSMRLKWRNYNFNRQH